MPSYEQFIPDSWRKDTLDNYMNDKRIAQCKRCGRELESDDEIEQVLCNKCLGLEFEGYSEKE